jgi:carbamoyl-phosphate synthase large subunit
MTSAANAVLMTSVSKKVPMITAVRNGLLKFGNNKLLYGADSDAACHGRYFVDGFWAMPHGSVLSSEDVVDWCHAKQVSVVFPSRDGELAFWAEHREMFEEEGIAVMVSDPATVATCLDKLTFHRHCAALGIASIETQENTWSLQGNTLVVKERYGSGAQRIGLNLSVEQALQHAQSMDCPVYQPFVTGVEVSADLYIDFDGKVRGVVLRRRDHIVDGESHVTTTFTDRGITALCEQLAGSLNLRGHIMFQFILDQHNTPLMLECNCRFGGASTLAVAAGLDSFYWFLLEASGANLETIDITLSSRPQRQIRYPADHVVPA